MAERAITREQLNRALLVRQLLLQRVKLSVPRAVERLGGIQNQYAPNAYIRLATCLEGFHGDQLTRALERRTVVQGTLMRATIHLVVAREYWLYAMGIRRALREWQLRVDRETERAMLRRRHIRDIMLGEPDTIEPDMPLQDAAEMLLESKVGCLPVVEGMHLVGIITEADFVSDFLKRESRG